MGKSRLEKALVYSFFGGFFLLLPFVIYTEGYDYVLPLRMLVFVILMIPAGILLLKNREAALNSVPGRVFYPFLATYAFLLLSGLTAHSLFSFSFEAVRWMLFFGFLFLSAWVIRQYDPDFRKISGFSAAYLIVSTLIGFSHYYGIAFDFFTFEQNQIQGTMGNVNLFASAQLFAMFIAALGIFSGNRKQILLSATGLLAGGLSIIPTGTESVYLALGGVVFTLIVLLPEISQRAKATPVTFVKSWKFRLIVLAIVTGSAGFWAQKTGKLDQFGSMVASAWEKGGMGITSRSTSVEERIILWKHSLQMASENPVLGKGAGNWKYEIGKYGVKGYYIGYGTRFYVRPHNEFLGVLAERGIGGFLAFLALIGLPLMGLFKIWANKNAGRDAFYAAMLIAGFVGFSINAFFSFPLERLWHTEIFVLMLALSGLLWLRNRENATTAPKWAAGILALVALTSVLAVWPAYERVKRDHHMLLLTEAQLSQNWEGMLKHAKIAEHPFFPVEPMASTPMAWYQGVAYFYKNRFPEALEVFQRAYSIHPNHLQVIQNLGSAYIKNNQIDKGIEMYNLTLERFPDFDECRRNLAEVYLAIGKMSELDTLLQYWEQTSQNSWYKTFAADMRNRMRQKTAGN